MGEKDITERKLADYADVFSDIVNTLLFHGKQVVKPEELLDALPRSIYKADGKLYEQERDNAKYWQIGGMVIALIGLEHQTDILKEMPVKVLSYDGSSYRKMLKDRDDARRNKQPVPPMYPVVTLVLYFGDRHWLSIIRKTDK